MKIRMTAIAAVALVVGSTCFASEALCQLKMGVVDLQLAVASTKAGKDAKDKLEKLTKQKQKEIDDKVEAIKKMEEEFEKQGPLMSEAGKKDMMEKYQKAAMEVQQLYVDNQTYLAKKKGEVLEPILKKMTLILKDMALSGGYTMILDASSGVVLYNEPTIDLTAELIKNYNKGQ
jgi:outer membrane protein